MSKCVSLTKVSSGIGTCLVIDYSGEVCKSIVCHVIVGSDSWAAAHRTRTWGRVLNRPKDDLKSQKSE